MSQIDQIDPSEYESDTHHYDITNLVIRRRNTVDCDTVSVIGRRKSDDYSTELLLPVTDCGIVGDLISGVYLERSGFERMEVFPDELRKEDVIDGLGPIVDIESIPGDTIKMIRVAVQLVTRAVDDEENDFASVLFSQEENQWLSKVGITRPIA